MSNLPNDLIPLSTMPWDERPDSLPLDVEECRTALWRARGNITEAAKYIKVNPIRFRRFVKGSPRLMEEWNESREQVADIAEEVVVEALQDETDPGRRDSMAKFVLGSGIGRARGYGTGGGNLTINSPKGPVQISWADGSSLVGGEGADTGSSKAGDDAKVVQGEVIDG